MAEVAEVAEVVAHTRAVVVTNPSQILAWLPRWPAPELGAGFLLCPSGACTFRTSPSDPATVCSSACYI